MEREEKEEIIKKKWISMLISEICWFSASVFNNKLFILLMYMVFVKEKIKKK